MNNYLLKIIIIFILCSGFMTISSDSDLQKKIIRSGDYDIEFYVSLKKKHKPATIKNYYWFKSGEIHKSTSSAGGHLLHSYYLKYYRSNQLAEKGKFNYGLKHGTWKQWYNNGTIEFIEEWKNGERNGLYLTYDSLGKTIYRGYYRGNEKSGDWINYRTHDTVSYSNGKIKVIDAKAKKSFLKRLFKKKDSQEETHTNENSKKPKNNKLKNNTNNKEGFFKRLFKKKANKETTNKKTKTKKG